MNVGKGKFALVDRNHAIFLPINCFHKVRFLAKFRFHLYNYYFRFYMYNGVNDNVEHYSIDQQNVKNE